MTALAKPLKTQVLSSQALLASALILGFALSLLVRIVVGGQDIRQSQPAALIFSACLIALAAAANTKAIINRRVVGIGILGGIFLCLPAVALLLRGQINFSHGNGYASWALTASLTALCEEAFFRGALYNSLYKWRGGRLAILLPAALFALLHLPMYGWAALPLDFAVGLWLGGLRAVSGSFVAPGIAHIIADLASWWL